MTRQRRLTAILVVWLSGVLTGCDALTTPEQASENLFLVIQLGAGVDTANLITGDTLDYIAFVASDVGSPGALPKSQSWTSSQSAVRAVGGVAVGERFVASRVASDTVRVEAVVATSVAGDVLLRGQAPVRVRTERFFGQFVPSPPWRFLDVVAVLAPPEQHFNASSQILFAPDPLTANVTAVPGIIFDRPNDSTIAVLVPAGFESEQVQLTNLRPDGRSLISRRVVDRVGNDNDLDAAEPNDTTFTATAVPIPLPGAVFPNNVFSIHGDANDLATADQDYFTFTPETDITLTVSLLWNVPSNLDFEIFFFDIVGLRNNVVSARSTSTSFEQATADLVAGRDYFLRIFATSLAAPTTYILVAE